MEAGGKSYLQARQELAASHRELEAQRAKNLYLGRELEKARRQSALRRQQAKRRLEIEASRESERRRLQQAREQELQLWEQNRLRTLQIKRLHDQQLRNAIQKQQQQRHGTYREARELLTGQESQREEENMRFQTQQRQRHDAIQAQAASGTLNASKKLRERRWRIESSIQEDAREMELHSQQLRRQRERLLQRQASMAEHLNGIKARANQAQVLAADPEARK